MITYNDFINGDRLELINTIISEFKASERYTKAITARKYFKGENSEINKRLQLFRNGEGAQEVDIFVANNKIANEYFKKIIMQENSYLLGNGVNLEESIKQGFSRKFDNNIFALGRHALIDGVAWAYCYIDSKGKFNVATWTGTEFIPLFDERTGEIMAGVRYWQIDEDKPVYIELYEIDGKTVYMQEGNGLKELEAKKNYIIKKQTVKALNIVEEEQNGFSRLPIFPLYANAQQETSLTPALKQKLDLWDIVISDFGNNLEDSRELYWVLTNYAGQDIAEFLAEYKQYKVIQTDSEGSAEAKTIEVPWQAREVLLNTLKKEIFQSAMALDTEELAGANLTNVAIKSIMANLDLKTDDFEIQALETLYNIVELYLEYRGGNAEDFEIELERRTIINDAEVVNLIYTMREDIDQRTALEKNPLISPKEVDEILKRSEEEKTVFKEQAFELQEEKGAEAPNEPKEEEVKKEEIKKEDKKEK